MLIIVYILGTFSSKINSFLVEFEPILAESKNVPASLSSVKI